MNLHNHRFWNGYFQSQFVPQIRAIADALEKRMLPAFSGIEQEAEKVSQEAWDSIMSSPGTGDEDLADFADDAEQAGVSHYMLLDGIRQGMVNFFAAALYHAFEQQGLVYLRQEVLDPAEQNDTKLFDIRVLHQRLKAAGIDVTAFSSWAKIRELRLVANTVKHAEGNSARELHQIRPDMFEHPKASLGPAFRAAVPRVFQPLVGDDLYVSLSDMQQYREALTQFWTELGEALQNAAAVA